MILLELILTFLSLIGLSLYLINIPNAFPFFAIPIYLLSILYFPFGFLTINNFQINEVFLRKRYKEVSVLNFLLAACIGLYLCILIQGIMAKVSYMPGSFIFLSTSFLSILALIIYLILVIRQQPLSKFLKINFRRIIIIGSLAIIAYMIPPIKIFEVRYRNYPTVLESVREALKDPNNPVVWEKVNKEIDKEIK